MTKPMAFCKRVFLKGFIWIAAFASMAVALKAQRKFYVSPCGSDAADGLTVSTAWQTLGKLNTVNFKSGDSILLQAGSLFTGNLLLDSADSGQPGRPVVITAYGNGKAVIDAGKGTGILATNVSNMVIRNIHVVGDGVETNEGNGIFFYSTQTNWHPGNIVIDSCDAEGFHFSGIILGCNEAVVTKGYNKIRITNCTASRNGDAGISSYGGLDGYHHQNVYVARCSAYDNAGILAKTDNHSGNGILMGGIDSLLVEYCEAYNNGSNNRCASAGPVGIWVWMCRNAVIQYSTSYNNHAGLVKDGGGFDIDGGSSNCILQYNYSYNNEGAGYLLAEYGALLPFTNNTVRFNISENDGRKNSYGGITLWGVDEAHKVTNSMVYNNTIILDSAAVSDGTPCAVALDGTSFSNVVVANNILYVRKKQPFIRSLENITQTQVRFLHNNYFSQKGRYHFLSGKKRIRSIKKWMRINEQQERCGTQRAYVSINPLFAANLSPNGHKAANSYCLAHQSALRREVFNCQFAGPMQVNNFFPGACMQ
ncbi:right-handed parallel beta-helix repeat-containing protein [Foetidibacter luteolus]|uniref:right-handed parallel beta-helix repeat-containing protein n=1 Tax=Foetidibacter luteolus TaxID=2608880 RepID=UPI001A98F057|nr:right-handed parallel beta-helix repeat-containing protein [Foetidibacter luteolus]